MKDIADADTQSSRLFVPSLGRRLWMGFVALIWLTLTIAFTADLALNPETTTPLKTTNDWLGVIIGEIAVTLIWGMFVLRQFISVRIDETGILYRTLLRKVSINYADMKGARLKVVAPLTPWVIFLLKIWHAHGVLNVFDRAFSQQQIEEMRTLIQTHFEKQLPHRVRSDADGFWLAGPDK